MMIIIFWEMIIIKTVSIHIKYVTVSVLDCNKMTELMELIC
jgi:hypothetical protein